MSRSKAVPLMFGGFVAVIAAAFYPIYFHPLSHNAEYKQIQKVNRAGVNQAEVQPAGLKIWSDPFKPK